MTGRAFSIQLLVKDSAYAHGAMLWMASSYPGVSATITESRVEICSHHSQDDLERIWRACLISERLNRRAQAERVAVLDSLLR